MLYHPSIPYHTNQNSHLLFSHKTHSFHSPTTPLSLFFFSRPSPHFTVVFRGIGCSRTVRKIKICLKWY